MTSALAKRIIRSQKPGYRSRAEMDAERQSTTRECRACHGTFQATSEFFVTLKRSMRNGALWTGLARECRACRNKRFVEHYRKDPKRHIERAIDYVRANPAPKRNRDAIRYMRRKKRNGCPPWADQEKLEAIYAIAQLLTELTGERHEVDHYYPLVHPTSCGLHVPWNLRVIPREDNQSKGNRLPDEEAASHWPHLRLAA